MAPSHHDDATFGYGAFVSLMYSHIILDGEIWQDRRHRRVQQLPGTCVDRVRQY
ncbi:hypothetical protein FOXG_19579 [Fusarium oxysporum f. sp. lycopersici 4287]|uniref:Uncharacterized protein n=1 Tax=Fusarium oxysporum f. sp. lycopersici (strain 4287 / CBS 123668 / FGSC 9935 / NRRL 34936) TaxID=426428 RepID=A0A0J9V4Q9_FUSO4|nr:hypothetical protein FOXG_19579 [Fusarium oxysporum f. sp. lycopersici 4287]KNB06143.1 hypothetical protein FOXG_19579 [Fusarium oxysporum f. sp. lycopersici 4287]